MRRIWAAAILLSVCLVLLAAASTRALAEPPLCGLAPGFERELMQSGATLGAAVYDLDAQTVWTGGVDGPYAMHSMVKPASRAAVPAMREAGGGAIVNVSSIAALRPRGLTTYSVSKSAVIGLTRAMAVDHGPEGIRVNCVAPGPVYTPMVYGRGMAPEARERRVRASVLGIEGTGWDIGHAVRFLASDQARYITGQVLVVDGGTTLRGPERST